MSRGEMSRARPRIASEDVMALAGLALIAGGVWALTSLATAAVVSGALLFGVAVLGALRARG